MNKLTITFLFVFIFSNSLIAQLVVGENASVTVAENASIKIDHTVAFVFLSSH